MDVVLSRLAEMPFLDRLELASLTGLPESTTYQAVRRLEADELVTSVAHTPEHGPHAKRYSLTAEGVRRLAHNEGGTVDAILRSRPVSAQWQRILLERLDSLTIVYSVIETISAVAAPVSVRLYRSHPLDAVVTRPDGRTIGIILRGRTSDRTSFDTRLQKLLRGPLPGALLFVAPDETRLRDMRRMLSRLRIPVFVALERDAVTALVEDAVWQRPSVSTRFDMQSIVTRYTVDGIVPREKVAARNSLPVSLAVAPALAGASTHLLPSALNPTDKRVLDLVADWPGITHANARTILGLKPSRFSQIAARLREANLIRTILLRGRRLVPSDRALGMLARRDRASVSLARRRWSAGDATGRKGVDWRAVPGRRLRQLLRHIEHTHGVHAYLASTIASARNEGWEVAQLDPPHRAARHFRSEDGMRSVHPDAFLMLKCGDEARAFFVEYERRAVRPSTMRRRIAPYLHYYSAVRPLNDHGVLPTVLIVVENSIMVPHFRRVANEEMDSRGIHIPIGVLIFPGHQFRPAKSLWKPINPALSRSTLHCQY